MEEDEVLGRDRPERRVERADDERDAARERGGPPPRAGGGSPRPHVQRDRDRREDDEQRLERERPGRGHQAGSGVTPRAPRDRRARRTSRTSARPERQRLLDHHHDARELLVGERREPEEPLGLVDVHVVVRLEAEDEHVREQLPGPEEDDREPDPPVDAQPAVAGRVDQQRPDERADDDEREVLQPVDERLRRAPPRTAPGRATRRARRARARRRRPAGGGTTASPGARRVARAARAGHAGGRTSTAARAPRASASATPRSAISTCWSMCADWRYSSAIASSGETRPTSTTATPGEEERDPRPRRAARPAPVEASPAVEEERDRDRRAGQHDRVERPRGPEVVGRSRRERAHRPTVALE